MELEKELAQATPEHESALTIGVFDGVHRGHCHLLTQLLGEARKVGRLAGVVTFRNHPASVLRPNFIPRYLTSFDERTRLIKEVGIDFIVPVTFDLPLSKLRAAKFVALLQQHLRMRELVIGPDFALGHEREGDAETLTNLGHDMRFSVSIVEPLVERGEPIRSSSAREALARGDVQRVAGLSGRPFLLTGDVVQGKGRGGPLGFPTANLLVPAELAVPGNGIYATWAHLDEGSFMAATSIGTRPTFGETDRTIEAFVLDYEGDLYGRQVRLEFVRRLRDELKYDTVEALQEQVDKDVQETRAVLGAAGATAARTGRSQA